VISIAYKKDCTVWDFILTAWQPNEQLSSGFYGSKF